MNPIDRLIKSTVKYLRGRSFIYPQGQTFKFLAANYVRTVVAIRGFYLISFVVAISNIISWWPQLQASTYQFPLWVFFSIKSELIKKLVSLICILWVLGSALAFYKPEKFVNRLLQASGIFYFVALINSDGLFSHSRHGLMWVSLIFLFIPFQAFKKPSRFNKFKLIQGFWAAQFLICTFYLTTGLWKIVSIGECLVYDQIVCELGPKILTNIAAQEMFEYQNFTPWGTLFFDYPWIGFFSYLGTMWIHLASMHFAFRLDQHSSFGALRVIFHLGTFVFFGVIFNGMTACVALLFLASPFSYSKLLDVREVFYRTPLVGDFFSLFSKRGIRAVSSKIFEPLSHLYLLRVVYSIICYQFCRDTSWGWRNIYEKLEISGAFDFMLMKLGPNWAWVIDTVMFSTIASSLVAALFPRSLFFRAMVVMSTVLFLSFFNFHLRGLFPSIAYLGVMIALIFTPTLSSSRLKGWGTALLSINVVAILTLNYSVWRFWSRSGSQEFSNSYIINLLIKEWPLLFFVLFQIALFGLLGLLIKDFWWEKYKRTTLFISLIFLALHICWKVSGTEFLLPLLIMIFYLDSSKPNKALN